MKRYLVSLLSLLFLVALPAAGQSETVKVNANSVNLRKAPSVDSGIVRALSKGTMLTVLSRDGNWAKVQMQGQTTTGWVRSDLLDAVPASSTSSTTPASQVQRNVVAPPPPPPAPAPPPPPSGRSVAPPPAPKPPKMSNPHPDSKNASYRGGLTLFGGITSFKAAITPSSSVPVDNTSGFAAGIGIIGHLGGPIGIEIDGAYVQKGFSVTGGGVTSALHDNYASGALLLRPAFGSGPVRFFLLGGGEIGYLINCSNSTTSSTPLPKCKIGDDQNKTDYGALVGAGISFGPLAVQVRYDIGIANLSKTTGSTVKNKGLLVLGSLIL